MTSIRKVRKKAIRKMGFRMSLQFHYKDPNQKLKLTPSVRKKIRQGVTEYLRKKCLQIKITGENSPYKIFLNESSACYTKLYGYTLRFNLGAFIQPKPQLFCVLTTSTIRCCLGGNFRNSFLNLESYRYDQKQNS